MKITIGKIRNLIRESLLLSADDLDSDPDFYNSFRSEMYSFKSEMVEFMNKHDIQVIPSGSSNYGVLGQGMYGIVFDVLWKGKRFALKITNNFDDANAYAVVLRLKQKVPTIPASSLPTVYLQDKINDYYFTLMENLRPLSDTLKSALFNVKYYDDYTPITPNIVAKFSSQFIKHLNQIFVSVLGDQLAHEVMNDSLPVRDKKYDEKFERFVELLNQGKIWPVFPDRDGPDGYISFEIELQDVLKRYMSWEKTKSSADKISKKFTRFMKSHLTTTEFPISGKKTDKKLNISDPKAKKLYLAMRWLTQNGYLKNWIDVHPGNIMIRPSTGEFVVADIGMFKFGVKNK